MMLNRIKTYWLCQLAGWTVYYLVYTFFYFTIISNPQANFFEAVFIDAILGLSVTHAMRLIIKSTNLLSKSLINQIFSLTLITIIFSFIYAFLMLYIEDKILKILTPEEKTLGFINLFVRNWFIAFLYLTIWNLLYYIIQFVRKNQKQQLSKIRLESLVKELELKTIKAHIHPHFIFNTLNSIRALVDENPEKARTAITQLSNILRSSMYAEKVDASTVEKELDIVKDYLALESIRFEDRLKIEYEIDDKSLCQAVPPMMLQTLVENAIKHGISKQVNGGIVKIISTYNNNFYELAVQNSGQLNGKINAEGFGIASTYDRLNLLFDNKAKFELNNLENMVQAKISIPI